MERYEIKRRAREQIKGNLLIIFLINLLLIAISAVSSFTGIVLLIVTGPLTLGYVFVQRNMYRREKARVETLFDGFKHFGNSFVLNFLQGLFLFFWSLLFFIPGIIKSFSYSMSYYILADNPEMSATEAITESRRMMNGNKMRLFIQRLSFIGWILLSFLTFGILLFVWVAPYMQQADYNFYLSLKGEEDEYSAPEEEFN